VEVSWESQNTLTEKISRGIGEKRQVGNPSLSSADFHPSSLGSDQLSALNLNAASGNIGPEKFRDTSTKAVLTDNIMSQAVPGQAVHRRGAKHNSFGLRRVRLRPLTVGQVL
jgi:hypothetical protein